MTKEEALKKFNEVNEQFQKLRLDKIKYEEQGLDTGVIEAGMAFNNGQLTTLREFITND